MQPRSRWIAVVPLISAFLAACSETTPTGVEPATTGPLLQISDATTSAGRAGFYFLPPMVSDPGPFTGTFDANLNPEVRVCQLAGSACGTPIKTFTTTTAEAVEISVQRQTYGVNWATKNNPSSLTTSAKYRIEVRVGGHLLGFADLAFVKASKDMGTVPAGTVAAVLGSPLNIKFRVETRTVGSVAVTPTTASIVLPGDQTFSAEVKNLQGVVMPNAVVTWASSNLAAATVSPASGGTATATGVAAGNTVITATAGGVIASASLTVMRKPNAEDDSYTGTVGQLLSPGATPAVPTLLANDDPGSAAASITSVTVDGVASALPLQSGGIPFAGGTLQVFANGHFSVSTTASGQHSFTYTLTSAVGSDVATATVAIGASTPVKMVPLSDPDQHATVGTAVAEPQSVQLLDAYDNPVPGVSVSFTNPFQVVGIITGSPATTDANGVATAGSWTLPTVARTYLATASAGLVSTTFIAHALPGPAATLTLEPLELSGLPGVAVPFSGGQTKRYAAFVRDAYGNGRGFFQDVDFSSANEAVAVISAQTTGSAIAQVTARYLTTDQTVELRASLSASPAIYGVATITVLATEPPPSPKPDRFDVPPCQALGCQFRYEVTGNVLSDNGSGADDLGNPPAVITRFGGPTMAGFVGGGVASIDGWFPVGTTARSSDNSTEVTLAADGTLTVVKSIGLAGQLSGFGFQYEVQNVWGTGTTTVIIVRSADGASVTTARPTAVRSNRPTRP